MRYLQAAAAIIALLVIVYYGYSRIKRARAKSKAK